MRSSGNTKEFMDAKVKFVDTHLYLVNYVFVIEKGHIYKRGEMGEKTQELVQLAREQINYSEKTWDRDIITGLWKVWRDMPVGVRINRGKQEGA